MLAYRLNCYHKTCLNKDVYFSIFQYFRDTNPCVSAPQNGQGPRSLFEELYVLQSFSQDLVPVRGNEKEEKVGKKPFFKKKKKLEVLCLISAHISVAPVM